MKKIWVYLLGLLSGIVITIVVLLVFGLIIRAKNDPGITMLNGMSFFETPGEVIKETSFKVFQALDDGAALAEGKGKETDIRPCTLDCLCFYIMKRRLPIMMNR